MYLAFQIEAVANSDGDREIVNIDCDSTTDIENDRLEAVQIDDGAWEFRFVLSEDFEDNEALFKRFKKYGLDPRTVSEACRRAIDLVR